VVVVAAAMVVEGGGEEEEAIDGRERCALVRRSKQRTATCVAMLLVSRTGADWRALR